MPTIERIDPPTIHPPRGWTHIVKVSGPGAIVYVSGMTGRQLDGSVVEGLQAQAEQAYRNLGEALLAAGAARSDVVKEVVLIVGLDPASGALVWPERARFWGDDLPASTVCGVSALAHPRCLIEVEVVAHVG